ncbi:MAG TPA: bifunctional alpha,alpha-trehalose-phosphate synthase (UDP-forming)/trehalose-phosphatase [Candidatus Saccharimonadales bacterium]|nr:bifunctional alpha,alpha-trehalose-phosphate synthase (UDP-forming)/trehalose-phosphatase [Candidatus Saccharimonadales bacterium]
MSDSRTSQKHDFIIVSNRLPVNVTKENGVLVFHPSTGGLATAMSSVGQDRDKVWMGWPGIASDDLTVADKRVITRELRKYNCVPVFLSQKQITGYYDGYANATIWPLFHYFQNQALYDTAFWEPYKEVNRVFQRAVVRHANPSATIWVHDYHFMLLPRLLRQELPASTIGFFLHIPFPSYEVFRILPHRVELLRGLLGADLVGFHTYDYARHFISSVQQMLGYETKLGSVITNTREITVDVFPIGIDYQKFVDALQNPIVKKEMQQLREHYDKQKLIISVDRLDYSKGIVGRLEAFDSFLERHPNYIGKVTLVVVAVPSRTDVDAYKQLRDTIELTVSRINGKYATMGWSPISYQYKNLPFEQIVALYALADIALVTPLRDGMNLVAKEYVAAKAKRTGVLILSEMAGASNELAEAIRVNPYDTNDIVRALEKALKMPATQQKSNLVAMQGRISRYSVTRWANDFIEQLARAKVMSAGTTRQNLSPPAQGKLLESYTQAKTRLFLLDYDGTLKDYVAPASKDRARPARSLLSRLSELAADPRNRVCIISGRTRTVLQAWFGALPLTLVAEHGAWIRHDGEWKKADIDFGKYKKKLLPIMQGYAERTPGTTVEEKDFALVWHYRGVTPELAYVRKVGLKHDLRVALAEADVDVFEGNKILEVKPRSISKGVLATEILNHTSADFVLCAGDDYTDEDMFMALPSSAWTIKVGPGATQARHHIESVDDMVSLLAKLASATKP